jgi:hypothetical protein
MATTNHQLESMFMGDFPHIANAFCNLVAAMADARNMRGKRSLFGKDKGVIAYKKFETRIQEAFYAMVLDKEIERTSDAKTVREIFFDFLGIMASIYPNWKDAYSFGYGFFVVNSEECEKILSLLCKIPFCTEEKNGIIKNEHRNFSTVAMSGCHEIWLAYAEEMNLNPNRVYTPEQLQARYRVPGGL